jgi:hypothetical protein
MIKLVPNAQKREFKIQGSITAELSVHLDPSNSHFTVEPDDTTLRDYLL